MNKDILIIDGIKYIRAEEQDKPNLKLYDVVNYNGYKWYIIKQKKDNITLLMKECLPTEKMIEIFDEENLDEDFNIQFNSDKTNNDWDNSIIQKGLNEVFISEFNKDELNQMNTNYDEDKYSKDYVRLLTIRNVEKLPKEIRECDRTYWTMSPSQFSTWSAVARVWNVFSDGTLYNSWTSSSWLGVRPVINLKSEYLINSQN